MPVELPTQSTNPKEAKAQAKAAAAHAKALRPWYQRKRWWAAGFVVLVIVAGAAGGSGSSTSGSGDKPSSGAASSSSSSSKSSSSSSSTKAASSSKTKANAANGTSTTFPMQDGDWRLESVQAKNQAYIGDFTGTARITYTGQDTDGGDNIFTVTLFKGETQVGTLQGSANSVLPGHTVTVQLISQDKYKSGPYRYAFQNDL